MHKFVVVLLIGVGSTMLFFMLMLPNEPQLQRAYDTSCGELAPGQSCSLEVEIKDN